MTKPITARNPSIARSHSIVLATISIIEALGRPDLAGPSSAGFADDALAIPESETADTIANPALFFKTELRQNFFIKIFFKKDMGKENARTQLPRRATSQPPG